MLCYPWYREMTGGNALKMDFYGGYDVEYLGNLTTSSVIIHTRKLDILLPVLAGASRGMRSQIAV